MYTEFLFCRKSNELILGPWIYYMEQCKHFIGRYLAETAMCDNCVDSVEYDYHYFFQMSQIYK